MTSFSGKPLSLIFWASVFLAAAGLLYGAVVIVNALTGPVQSGWSSLMATIIFFFSLNALFTGVIGLYVKRVLEEIKDRPRTIVQDVYRRQDSVSTSDPKGAESTTPLSIVRNVHGIADG